MDSATIFFAFLWWLLGGGSKTAPSSPSSPSSPQQLPPATGMQTGTKPWPQVVPSGLPSFPGPGWEYDEPPPKGVHVRAGQLVEALWKQGSGTYRIEQTDGRWIAYRAEIVRSGKKGVVAYRLKSTKPAAPKTAQQAPAPAAAPAAAPAPAAALPTFTATSPGWKVKVQTAQVQAPPHPPRPRNIAALPDRKYGDGMKPQAADPVVLLVQQELAARRLLQTVPDGRFGNDTRNAVILFQQQYGLAPSDQTTEQLKARGFGAVKQATWQKLFASRT